MNVMLKP